MMQSRPVKERGYARPDLLAETDWLAQHLNDPKVRIIDARPPQQYAAGHLPGSVNLNGFGGVPRATNGDMAGPEEFVGVASKLGVSDDTTVVVYDAPSQMMGMVAWSFLYYGHPDVRILDGGLAKWSREGRPATTEVTEYPPAVFSARPVEGLYCSLSHAKAARGQSKRVFWDTRSLAEYEGTASAGADTLPRLGHIPGAIHLEWSELFDPTTRTLKPAAELRALLTSKGLTPDREIDTY